MSGGHWDYAGYKLLDTLNDIGHDGYARDLWPLTTAAFQALAKPLYDAEHAMDWALSGDTDPAKVNDREMFLSLLNALKEVSFDIVLPTD